VAFGPLSSVFETPKDLSSRDAQRANTIHKATESTFAKVALCGTPLVGFPESQLPPCVAHPLCQRLDTLVGQQLPVLAALASARDSFKSFSSI
jgi:hypothetical protein